MSSRSSLLGASVLALAALAATGCLAETGEPPTEDSQATDASHDELLARADAEWFYGGALPALEQPRVTVSLKGHTARVSGLLPAGVTLPALPHVRARAEGARTRIDAVYPIATARPGKSNSRPGSYRFQLAKPYRPDGAAFTPQEGTHFVPWGGFPFIAYNDGIAFHGPITSADNVATDDAEVWVLKRGAVSGGCNRMMGEHVVELSHAIGIDMRKAYRANESFTPKTPAVVDVIADYDLVDGKYVDVDYPTDVGVVRPGKVHGAAKVAMFGSWVASELPNGKDLPKSLKWEAGVSGDYYVFAEHVLADAVCSVAKADLTKLRAYTQAKGALPADFCAKRDCYLGAIRAGATPACR